MPSTFFGLEIARRGLITNKTALDVTGHNVANANTAGYSRQTVSMGTSIPLFQPSLNRAQFVGQIGTGVQVDEIKRYRETFLDLQYRNENRGLGYWEVRSDTLQKVQELMAEHSGSGLSSVMDQFWEAWEDLTVHPTKPAARGVVVQRGKAVAETFNYLARQLRQLEVDLNDKVQTIVDEVNSISKQIADLNGQILAIEVTKDNANDLRDKRDLLLDKLSKLVDINVSEDNQGMVNVGAGNGSLVTGVHQKKLVVVDKIDAKGKSLFEVQWETGLSTMFYSGALRGALESRGTMVDVGYSSKYGSDKFDWQSNMNQSNGSVIEVGRETIVGTYGVDVTVPATKKKATLTLAPISAPQNIQINGYDIALTNGPPADDANTIAAKINALTSFTGVKATVVGADVEVEATAYGSVPTFSIIGSGDVAVGPITGGNDLVASLTRNGTPVPGTEIVSMTGSRVVLKDGLTIDVTVTAPGAFSFDITKREGIVADMRRKLDRLAKTFTAEINKKHQEGVSLEDIIAGGHTGVQPPSNIKFFIDRVEYETNLGNKIDPTYLENIFVNPELENLSKIAAARPESQDLIPFPNTSFEGDGRNALVISQMKYTKIASFPQQSTCDEYYRSVIGDLGVDGQQATRMFDNQTVLTETVKNQRDSVTSVSLDEEMTNMIRFQQAYNAAARMISAADEMLDTIVNRMGMVGR